MIPKASRALRFAICLLASSSFGMFPTGAQAQDQGASRDFGLKVTAGGSERFVALGLEGAMGVAGGLDLVVLGEMWERNNINPPGPVQPEPQPHAPYDAAGLTVGAGARAHVIESPRTFASATAGFHRYKSGEVAEHAPFLGLGLGQTWALLTHFEVGWEFKARRVSAYQKARYFPLDMETRETTKESEYLFALTLSLGGAL